MSWEQDKPESNFKRESKHESGEIKSNLGLYVTNSMVWDL
jgi:hypothetical protein